MMTICKKIFNDWRWRERLVHNGSAYPDQTFYVIRRHASRAGLFSFVMTNLASIDYALQQGWIPVIDMQNSPNPMLPQSALGKQNAWEYYFKQPCGYSLDDVAHARNVVLSLVTAPQGYPEFDAFLESERAQYWHRIADQYLHVRDEHLQEAERYVRESLDGERYLGVLCRGTDYVSQRPSGHPIQPQTERVIADCRRELEERSISHIYLATEDQDIWTAFEQEFPGQIYSYQQVHYSVSGDQNINDVANAVYSAKDRNRDYLISILILAQAEVVLAGAANGSYGAYLLRRNGGPFHFYNLGLYP